jgi:hypothetical protein
LLFHGLSQGNCASLIETEKEVISGYANLSKVR